MYYFDGIWIIDIYDIRTEIKEHVSNKVMDENGKIQLKYFTILLL